MVKMFKLNEMILEVKKARISKKWGRYEDAKSVTYYTNINSCEYMFRDGTLTQKHKNIIEDFKEKHKNKIKENEIYKVRLVFLK